MPYQEDITKFAKTNFRNREVTFGIKTDDRRRHMYIIGKTGMGKTNLLEHLVIQDIRNGHGVAYVDPHGDTAEKLIRMIPPERLKDVIYFNPADQNFPIAFNVMERVDPEFRHLIASGLVSVFKKLWADSWGPRLEYILRNAILALLEYPDSTLLGVMRLLVDKKYQKEVVRHVTDPVVRSFWTDEFTKWNERVLQEVIAPIQNKVGQFLSTSLIRNIVGQTESSFSIREIMDQKKILILNLSKGRIGEDNSALLGAMMISKIQLAAMGRVDMPEQERNDFYLYVDEFQNFATESFANILSEARKYRLNLILANQYVNQIDEIVRDAIFGNAGTLISFRVGATDAEFLEKEFEPVFMQNDIINLPKYHIYLKLMIDGVAADAFSASTLPPIEGEEHEDVAERVIAQTREHYASSREEVEKSIRVWSGMEESPAVRPHQTSAPTNAQKKHQFGPQEKSEEVKAYPKKRSSDSVDYTQNRETRPDSRRQDDNTLEARRAENSGSTRKDRVLYDTVCETCGEPIQVPFKPDGSRPTFCREHLRDYQRTLAKAEKSLPQKTSRRNHEKPQREERQESSEKKKEERSEQYKVHATDQPMRLSQMRYVAPKKFRSLSKTNNKEIREMLDRIRKSNDAGPSVYNTKESSGGNSDE